MCNFFRGLPPEAWVLAFSAVIGPVLAVLMSLYGQYRMEKRHQKSQREFLQALECERRQFEMTRVEARGKYEDAWNVAIRDQFNEIKSSLKSIADALESYGGLKN